MLRCLGITLLCFIIGFCTMVAAAIAFSSSWVYAAGLLGLIWLVYFFCQLFRWKLAGNIWLAAFIGFASDVLRELDPLTSSSQADLLKMLPSTWVGTIGLAFYFPFVTLLPWLASQLANKLQTMKAGSQGKANPQTTGFGRISFRSCSRSVARGRQRGEEQHKNRSLCLINEDFEQRMSLDHGLAVRS